jgi:hypothetical protein
MIGVPSRAADICRLGGWQTVAYWHFPRSGVRRESAKPTRPRSLWPFAIFVSRRPKALAADRSARRHHGSLSKPSPKPFRLIGKPMPSSGVWKMMKVEVWPLRI